MFRLETTRTTGKDNFIKVRGLTRPRFFYVVIIRRSTRASSPVRQRKVVSNKLFPKIERFSNELLELREK